METLCSQASHCGLMKLYCFVYDFQTLLTGILAIAVAIVAGIPVWRQLKDSNLQARISHRETLAALLRDALTRFERVEHSIAKPLSMASEVTHDPAGEPTAIQAEDAHGIEQSLTGVLDWYFVVLANTEHPDIEARKATFNATLSALMTTLSDAHWADHNEQIDDDRDIPDAEWASILARCAAAKLEAPERVSDAEAAFRQLKQAQSVWANSLRSRIAILDLQIAAAK